MKASPKFTPLRERLLSKIKIDSASNCWEWQAQLDRDGYGKIQVDGSKRYAHRISYEVNSGSIPDGMCVCHSCDNPCCVNPGHLFLGTHADNVADKFAKGRGVTPLLKGSANGQSKLTEADVFVIRAVKGLSQGEIAKQFGVSRTTISDIRRGATWAT